MYNIIYVFRLTVQMRATLNVIMVNFAEFGSVKMKGQKAMSKLFVRDYVHWVI